MNTSELPFLVALGETPKIGPKKARLLISYCGGVKAIFSSAKKTLLKIPGIGIQTVGHLMSINPQEIYKPIQDYLDKNPQVTILPYFDERYPQRLKHYEDAPLYLFYAGNYDLNEQRFLGIVGTRDPSQYGKLMVERLLSELSNTSVCIISGLAYGIDTEAHRQAVAHNLPTIGVLGHGLDKIYPSSNMKLAKQMIMHGGILSEFLPGTEPNREHFPMRNRIIAALSDGLIVVESKESGGSMITARFAHEYSKDVLAIPGRAGDPKSKGCNMLIKEHVAAMVESGKDVLEALMWTEIKDEGKQKTMFYDANPEEQIVIDYLKDNEDAHIDLLQKTLAIKPSKISALLLNLEFNGIIKTLPGKRYILA